MFDQKAKKWQHEILKRLDIPENLFSDVIDPGTELGSLSDEVCDELKINPLKIVAPTTHDTASAVTGIPVFGKQEHWAFASIGTWCTIGIETRNLILSDDVVGTGFFNEGGAEGNNLFVKDINGLWVIQQCRDKWMRDKGINIPWDDIDEQFIQSEPFKAFIDPDERIFFETQNNMPQIIVEYCTKTGQQSPESINEIARCIYESLALRIRYDLEVLERLTNGKMELLQLIGGGTHNKSLCQFIANSTGIPVIAGPVECTSVGNLIMQLKGSKEIKNLKEGREISKNSSKIKKYYPEDINKWNEVFLRFKKLIK
jgi:sugar (pentulose or hexulose) kinase